MRRNVRNNGNRTKRRVNRFASEKKKVAIALCLIMVMGFMWIRVLTRKAPQSAAGATIEAEPSSARKPANKEVEITFTELPKVAGRNDGITRDFFDAGNWESFIDRQRKRNGIEEVNIYSKDGNDEVVRKVAGKLKLEAIMVSEKPRAYINGEVVEVGDKMVIGDGPDKIECDVVSIEENSVVIKCRQAEIILKLVRESKTDG
jgi:hypothetical protein